MSRLATIERQTRETQVTLTLQLDGSGQSQVNTGLGFLDHMLVLFAGHGLFDLTVAATGDLHIDGHHTVEDIGIVLGLAMRETLGDKAGIFRYGHFTLPMDETLSTVAVDFGGRTHLVWNVAFPSPVIGTFDTELFHEFWQGFAGAAQCNLHCQCHYGSNGHHIAESVFKAAARAMRMAVAHDPRRTGVPSTKGTLTS
ncbi:MAG: imidazoleglycerol-phosphate dehydratase HisB [Thermoguttaceae bacterium]